MAGTSIVRVTSGAMKILLAVFLLGLFNPVKTLNIYSSAYAQGQQDKQEACKKEKEDCREQAEKLKAISYIVFFIAILLKLTVVLVPLGVMGLIAAGGIFFAGEVSYYFCSLSC